MMLSAMEIELEKVLQVKKISNGKQDRDGE